ncbi:MAG: hypothetical protein KY468_06090 [Armatimonadetes bacterium]|nr:hypothetical protein [Armatimonadota bacterium]
MADETIEPQYCRFLRTKKMYIPAYALMGDPREETETAQYWCLKTHTGIGPDSTLVRGASCRPGRPCCEVDF